MSRLALLLCAAMAIVPGAPADTAELRGMVRDAQGHALAATSVDLRSAGPALTAQTDASGNYHFRDLAAGSYTLRSGDTEIGPFTLSPGENRKLDLTLGTAQPQFFDKPTFIVAGVTDPSLRGGHGSDPVFRSTEALSKATDSLRTAPPAAVPVTPDALRAAIAREPQRADLHHALADAQESTGNSLEAAREFQRAAELESSEAYLFDWGADLLKHRAAEQAGEIFARANRLYPRSTRVLLGLAASLYSRGLYDEAAPRFFEAADLDPEDTVPYLFLGRLPAGTITDSDGYLQRISRFATLQPANALANYYYALCLWRRGKGADAQPLLEKAVRIDPRLAPAWLQLGNILADGEHYPDAVSAYRKAAAADPSLEEAHYRLAQLWKKMDEPAKAREEIALYRQSSQEAARKSERERSEIQEFVFSLRGEK
jgi:tetratricopeptide (TPR) repeat protein